MLDLEKNVIVFEIDKYDDSVDRTEEERKKIDEKNDDFLNTMVAEKIENDYFPCSCTNGLPDNVNEYSYGLIIISEHGEYVGVAGITRECKRCNKIEYWGDLEAYTQCMAQVLTPIIGLRSSMEDIPEAETEKVTNVDMTTDDNTIAKIFGPDCILTDIEPHSSMDPNDVELAPIEDTSKK